MKSNPEKVSELAFRINQNSIPYILRMILGLLFLVSGILKIMDPVQFVNDIDNYRMLPYILVTLMAIILPWLELLCGIALITGIFKHGAALIILILSVIFLTAIISVLFRGLDISCGCFSLGESASRIGFTKLLENILLLLAAAVLYFKLLPSESKSN